MKFSLNTIQGFNKRYHCAGDVAAIGVDKLLEKIGAQLGAVEEVIEIGAKYQGIVVAKVVSCKQHPNADRLHVCTIDDGGNTPGVNRDKKGLVQVVCGAPNVRAGLVAAWLPPGATVPETVGKEPFVLEARELRGVVSNGMLASPKELGLGDSHEGLLELDDELKPGTDFAEAYGLKDDILLDIENKMFTHRPDCFGFLGIARELAGIQGMPFKSSEWYKTNITLPKPEAKAKLELGIINELPQLVPRFAAVTMSDVEVGSSPVWLQVELAKVGQKSINNIVDYTNWFMLLTGQPLHAYDYDKVKALSGSDGAKIVIRNPKPGEKIKLLNGKEIEPRPEAIMIATDKQVIGIGGVMGGLETEVDENTKNIILECANFDMYSIRRTSMAHGLFTDAVTRFTKGQSPLQNLAVLAKIAEEIRQHAGGKIAGPVIDDNHLPAATKQRNSLHPPVKVAIEFVNSRLGLKLSAKDVKNLLENVEFKVDVKDDELTVTAPFWRTDIELREDVVEEIGRLYGFDKLPLELPKRHIIPTAKNPMLELKAYTRQSLSKAGANEVLTYSFVPGDLLNNTGQDTSQAFQLANALSPELQYYRLSLSPSLLEKVHPNIKAGYGQFALFEIGKAHTVSEYSPYEPDVPKEVNALSLVVAAEDKIAKKQYAGAAYYQARQYLTELLDFHPAARVVDFEPLEGADLYKNPWFIQMTAPFEPKRSAVLRDKGGRSWGGVGEYKTSVRKALKLPDFCAGFEIDPLLLEYQGNRLAYVPLPRFPKVTQDITLKVPAGLSYQTLFDFIWAELGKVQPKNTLPNLSPVDIYQSKDDTKHKNITLRLSIASYDRTMTDKEVNKLLDEVAFAAKKEFGAERL